MDKKDYNIDHIKLMRGVDRFSTITSLITNNYSVIEEFFNKQSLEKEDFICLFDVVECFVEESDNDNNGIYTNYIDRWLESIEDSDKGRFNNKCWHSWVSERIVDENEIVIEIEMTNGCSLVCYLFKKDSKYLRGKP